VHEPNAARTLGAKPGETVMVGDAMTVGDAAWAAGMAVIGVPYGYHRGDDILRER